MIKRQKSQEPPAKHPTPKHPTKEDAEIGLRMRQARKKARMAQGELGQRLGVSFQQVQKYENGANRISAARLLQAAAALNVSTEFLLGIGNASVKPLATADDMRRELGAALLHLNNLRDALAGHHTAP